MPNRKIFGDRPKEFDNRTALIFLLGLFLLNISVFAVNHFYFGSISGFWEWFWVENIIFPVAAGLGELFGNDSKDIGSRLRRDTIFWIIFVGIGAAAYLFYEQVVA